MANSQFAEQRIMPYLAYSDASAAIDFLCSAFGFDERFRLPMPDGTIGHAEIVYGGNVLMLASAGGEAAALGFTSPRDLAGIHAQVYCRVDDVDAHYEQAKAAGATIAAAPRDQHGERAYRAMDPEGHRWIFGSPLSEEAGVEHE